MKKKFRKNKKGVWYIPETLYRWWLRRKQKHT